MLKSFYNSRSRGWAAVFLSSLFALGIVVGERGERQSAPDGAGRRRAELFLIVEQPHLGQDRGDESSLINVSAPSMYANASSQTLSYKYRAGPLTPIGEI
jgi:hypothetical protein